MEKNDSQMNEKIYRAAKILFYENGYKKTTYKQIGEAVNGNSALIAYYYGSKGRLAVLVYNEYMNAVKTLVKENFKTLKIEYDVLLATAVEINLHSGLMRENRNLSRFFSEIMSENILVKEDAVNEEYFREMVESCGLKIPDYKINYLNYGEFGFRQGAGLAHEMGKIDCSYREFINSSIETLLLLLRQGDRIEAILSGSVEIAQRIPKLSVKKGFQIISEN